jgi:hypothetical protein
VIRLKAIARSGIARRVGTGNNSADNAFDRAIRSQLAQGGVRVEPDGSLVLDPTFQGEPKATQRELDYLNQRQRTRSVLGRVQLSWVENLHHTVGRLVAGDSVDDFALRVVLFLRLHGLFVDFPKSNARIISVMGEGESPPGSIGAKLRAVLAAIEQMRRELTEDEQLYAEYRRHVDGHLWQSAYEPQWPAGAKEPSAAFTSKYTDAQYPFAEVEERIAGVLRRYRSEAAIADDFARRLAPHAARLLSAMTVFCSPT